MRFLHFNPTALVLSGTCLLLVACAFNVVILQKTPTQLTPAPDSAERWVLQAETRATLAAGWASPLKPGTAWRKIGEITEGAVLRTTDQVVTVEASNLYQADIVVEGGHLVGFYLPVDHLFTKCTEPTTINLIEQRK